MSTYSVASGNIAWRTSSRCDAGACVGVARQGDVVLIANTSEPDSPVSTFTMAEWNAFLAGAKLGEFDDLVLFMSTTEGRRNDPPALSRYYVREPSEGSAMTRSPDPGEDVTWRKSRTCESSGCVEVARQGEFVLVRSTSNPHGAVSAFTTEEWSHFLAGAKLGDFDGLI